MPVYSLSIIKNAIHGHPWYTTMWN